MKTQTLQKARIIVGDTVHLQIEAEEYFMNNGHKETQKRMLDTDLSMVPFSEGVSCDAVIRQIIEKCIADNALYIPTKVIEY